MSGVISPSYGSSCTPYIALLFLLIFFLCKGHRENLWLF